MKRRTFLAAASVLGIAPALSACSSQTSQGSAESLSKDTEAELTLFYWDKAQKPTIEANIAAFNKEYPKIKVTPSVAVYKDYWTKLRTQAEGDQLPDVFWMNGPNFQLYAGNGMLAELDDLQDVAWDKYPKALVELYTAEGKKYGVPKDFDTIACFISKEIFAKAGVAVPTSGWTWEEHHAAAKAIADTEADHLFMDGQAGILWGGSWLVKTLREKFTGDEVVVVPLPKGEKEATIIHGLSYAASAKSKNLPAAKALIKAFTSQAGEETEATNGTAIPAFNGTQAKWLEQAPSWNLDVFTKAADSYAVPYPVSKNTAVWEEKQNTILSDVFTGQLAAEEGCKKLAAEMNTALGQE